MLCLSICFVSFVPLVLSGVCLFLLGFYFVINDLVYFIEWDIITLNSGRVVMTFLFD
jgi:NADH-ubiquinone oxidoreductase chain 5